ncbi:chorion peroxidase-like [Plakobranchus ocellatus]|uniref:Chorion peroxidase-like n=1 Tax=Plakobranchus ocellatus TaxID=259542 RepID=A0AAV4BW23_9GAST|nr:chorion peroxidase-like [Plakobranchus ocellatus]
MDLLLIAVLGTTLVLHPASGLTSNNEICASYPELYYANIAGRIPGGIDILSVGDQTLCKKGKASASRYRQIDGRCNHPQDMGSTMKPVKRYIKAHYQDPYGYNMPRMLSVFGTLLPSARAVSRSIHTDRRRTDSHTLWVMQLGQFIDHDITSAPVPTGRNSSIKCCGVPPDKVHTECFPIIIPRKDHRFRSCMEFVRSEPDKDEHGNVKYPREQLNALTSFLDGSAIYGSDSKHLAKLRMRKGKGALLNTKYVGGKERLPKDFEPNEDMCLVSHSKQSFCQLSGQFLKNCSIFYRGD